MLKYKWLCIFKYSYVSCSEQNDNFPIQKAIRMENYIPNCGYYMYGKITVCCLMMCYTQADDAR